MNDDVALVIFQAKAAISKACDGRACLPECLRALDRFASVETAPAPLFASCANAAKRTPAYAPPHGARLRVPVGAVRMAWRAFAFLLQRARGMFRRIWSGSAALLPAMARPVKIAIAAVATTLGVTCPSGRAVAAAVCVWQGDRYVCSGDGSVVNVVGGGDGGVVGDVVITNIVGVCTNCVAMSPEYVREWKDDALTVIGSEDYNDGLFGDCSLIDSSIRDIRDFLSDYTNRCEFSPWYNSSYPSNTTDRRAATNFLHSVGAYPGETPSNPAARLTQNEYDLFGNQSTGGNPSFVNYASSMVGFYDGAASAYYNFAPAVESALDSIKDIETSNSYVLSGLRSLRSMIVDLPEEECSAQWDGPPSWNPGSGGGSTVVTNQVDGNWCTYDQGEAIKKLLNDINKYVIDSRSYLSSISNSVVGIEHSIRSSLFSRYTSIPDYSHLGDEWQTVYLAGQPTDWGYEPTNILQRIELLIYGMSGVGTNATDVTEATGIDADDAETAGDDAKNAIDELSIDATSASEDVRTIMDALQSFFTTFNALTGDSFSRQVAIGSYSIEIGETRYDVPALTLYSDGTSFADVVQSSCRAFLTCLYLLFAVFCAWRFYAFFLGSVVKYSKWAQELLSSLFAD